MRGLRAVRVAFVAALVVAVGGCGGDDDGVVLTAAQRVEAAAATTAEQGTARIAMKVVLTGPPDIAGAAFAGEGFMALDGNLAELEVELAELRSNFTMRIVDGAFYYRYPAQLMADLGSDAEWVRLDIAELVAELGYDADAFQQLQQQDPSQMLRYLAAVGGSVDDVGTATLRGVDTTHFRALLDTSRREFDDDALDALGIDADGLRSYLTTLSETYGVDEVPIDVWIDDAGAVRRFEMKLDLGSVLAAEGVAGTGTMVMSMEFFDFGVEFDVDAPDPGDVVDFVDLFGAEALGLA